MSEIWIVQRECGDYYCEGQHVAAIATSEAEAERLRDKILALTTRHTYVDREDQTLPAFYDYELVVAGPFTVGEIDVPYSPVVDHPAPSDMEKFFRAQYIAPMIASLNNTTLLMTKLEDA